MVLKGMQMFLLRKAPREDSERNIQMAKKYQLTCFEPSERNSLLSKIVNKRCSNLRDVGTSSAAARHATRLMHLCVLGSTGLGSPAQLTLVNISCKHHLGQHNPFVES